MDTAEKLDSSTPFRCRHDSGFESDQENKGLPLELSPIRKPPSAYHDLKKSKTRGLFQNWIRAKFSNVNEATKKLDFSKACDINNNSDDKSDRVKCDTSVPSNRNLDDLSSIQLFTDEISNLTISTHNFKKDKVYQPLKYVCRDLSDSQGLTSSSSSIDSGISDSYDEILPIITRESSRLDFLHELDIRNCTGIISDILSHLSDEDLRQASYVCRNWQFIIQKDPVASKRKFDYLKNKKNSLRGPDKENRSKGATNQPRIHKTAFTKVTNLESDIKQPLKFDNILGRLDCYIQALKDGENVKPCPRPECRYPAKVVSGSKFRCIRNLCQHEFCEKCSDPYLDNHVCRPVITVCSWIDEEETVVCSKRSQRSVKRLLRRI